jgi:hypothetical protein
MTLLELVSYLRKNILHDTGGYGAEWEGFSEADSDSIQLRWTNEELVSYINESIKVVYRRINPILDSYEVLIKEGITEYKLPTYIKRLITCRKEDGSSIEEKDMFYLFNANLTLKGPIRYYISDKLTDIVFIYPIPAKDEKLKFQVFRTPKEELTWDCPDIEPELEQDFQVPMLFYAAALCYMKDEANTLDPKRAETFMGYFDREFPFTSAYANVRKKRTANKPIKFGGL